MSGEDGPRTEPPLLTLLQRAVLWFSEHLRQQLADAGVAPITPAHVTVLGHLDDEAPVSIAELARRAGVTRQTMHRAVTQLVEEGLLASRPGPGYPRSNLVELTAAGHRRRDVASGILRDLETELAALLGATALDGMRVSLAHAWPSSPADSTISRPRGGSIARER